MATRPKNDSQASAVSVRISDDVISKLDEIAETTGRTRSNLIAFALKKFVDRDRPYKVIESIINLLRSDEAERGDHPEVVEFSRGQLHGAKWMLSTLMGDHVTQGVLDEYRTRSGNRIPHVVGLAPDGNRYGFDIDAG